MTNPIQFLGNLLLSPLTLAAEVIDPTNPAFWTSLGIGGLAVVSFIKGWIVPGWVVDEYRVRVKEQADSIKELNAAFRTDLLPALDKSSSTQEKVLDYLINNPARRNTGR